MENVELKQTHQNKHESGFDRRAIWRTFWILLVITCIELTIGIFIAPSFPHDKKIWFNILYIIFTAAKAFYIIAEFMHLRHEIKNMIMTVAVPAMLFLWFIGAFLWDGSAFKNSRNTYNRNHSEKSKQVVPHDAQKPGGVH
jgi:cytochrome c oxidase subunit IV